METFGEAHHQSGHKQGGVDPEGEEEKGCQQDGDDCRGRGRGHDPFLQIGLFIRDEFPAMSKENDQK
jgi:hypothetical protein